MMAFMAIFNALSLYIVEISVPIIQTLYNLFEKLATFEFLSDKYVTSVWNNIYVLVGVIVMFAIAIKLISTIVNPDTLTDNKKGVKGLYFRTVIAVVMIFIIPILFTYSFELQSKLIDSNFLISRVFGYKISDDTSIGKLLAWTSFSSFCSLGEDASEEDIKAYNRAKEDIGYLGALLTRIRKEDPFGNPAQVTQGVTKYGSFNYHSILCPLTVLVVAYELFLLCMDTLFRAAKLAVLELMLPIVLGAFVFNPEILKKWAKEFISTYLSLFLKVIAIGFMVISFVSINAYVEGDPFFKNWLMQGFFNTLFIIALLQLVKKIPDLINTIFGTHIKTTGGIKGRLGEMAGIGAIASKAWTSLGTGAKNLGKMALMAPAVGAAYGANALYKSKHNGKSFMDTEAFRRGKGALYFARSAVKNGSPMTAYQEYEKMSAPPQHTRDELARIRSGALSRLDEAGVTHGGTWTNEDRDANGNITHDPVTGKQNFKRRSVILDDINKTRGLFSRAFSDTQLGRNLDESKAREIEAGIKYNDILGVQKQGEKVVNQVENVNRMIQNGDKYTATEKAKSQEIYDRLLNGDRVVTKNDAEFLRKYMNTTQAEQFKTVVSRYDDAFQTALEGNSNLTVQDLIASGALSGTLANAKAAVDQAKNEQKEIIDKMSDADKIAYNTYSEILDQQTSSLATSNAFNSSAPTDRLVDNTIDRTSTSTAHTQGWADGTWFTSADVGSEIKGSDFSSPSPAPTPQTGQEQVIETVDTAGNGSRVDPDALDPNSELGMIKRVNELREKRSSGNLTPDEREELNDKISTIRRIQRDRHGNKN